MTPFKDLYWKIKVQQSRDMLGMQSKIPRVKKAGYLLPVLPLLPIKSPGLDEEKGRYIAFDLRTRVGRYLHNLSGCFLWKNEDKKMPKDNKLCYS